MAKPPVTIPVRPPNTRPTSRPVSPLDVRPGAPAVLQPQPVPPPAQLEDWKP